MTIKEQQYCAHIERYKKYPMVVDVLTRKTSFREQVEQFYDSGTHTFVLGMGKNLGPTSFTEDVFRDLDPKKLEQYPKEIVEILNGFTEEPLDTSRLEYNAVREDFRRIKKHQKRRTARSIVPTTAAALATGAYIYWSSFDGDHLTPYETLTALIVIGGIALGSPFLMMWAMSNAGGSGEFTEYKRLCGVAEKADGMTHHFRNSMLEECLRKHTQNNSYTP